MARFERLLIPIILVIVAGAFLLESADPGRVRAVALGIGLVLVFAIVVGMIHRVRKKGREQAAREADQTSNGGGDPPPPAG